MSEILEWVESFVWIIIVAAGVALFLTNLRIIDVLAEWIAAGIFSDYILNFL